MSGQSLSQFTVWRGDTGATFSQAGAGYSWQVRQALSFANVEDLFGKTENFTLLEGSALANKLFGEKQVAVFRGHGSTVLIKHFRQPFFSGRGG